jgi:hypothetical protein
MMENIIISIFFKKIWKKRNYWFVNVETNPRQKNLKTIFFWKKRNYWFVIVETNPRLRCVHRKYESKII